MIALLIIFTVILGGCILLGRFLDNLFFSDKQDITINTTHIHNHYHQHEHKSISIIDDHTKQKIFELRESEIKNSKD